MNVIFARHGNTFAKGDKLVWVGKREDLPLVEKGFSQAHDVAKSLEPLQSKIQALYTGPLQRARQTAAIIQEQLSLPEMALAVDDRLNEIDYGVWGGKSTEEIEELGFGEALVRWDKHGEFPNDAGWSASEQDLLDETQSFLDTIAREHEDSDAICVVVTSNGLLRFILRHLEASYEKHRVAETLKVRTGALCGLQYQDGSWHELFWNLLPEEFRTRQTEGLWNSLSHS